MLNDKLTMLSIDEIKTKIRKDAEAEQKITELSLEIYDFFEKREITKRMAIEVCNKVKDYLF